MERTVQYSWLNKEDFIAKNPRSFGIVGFGKDDKGKDTVLLNSNGDTRRMNLHQKLNNELIAKYGPDDENWIGQSISIEHNRTEAGEYRKTCRVL